MHADEKCIFNWKNDWMPNTKCEIEWYTKLNTKNHTNTRTHTILQLEKKLNTSISSFIRQDGTNGNCLSQEWKNHRVELNWVAWHKKKLFQLAMFIQSVTKQQQQQKTASNKQRNKNSRGQLSWKIRQKFSVIFIHLRKMLLPKMHYFRMSCVSVLCSVSLYRSLTSIVKWSLCSTYR